MGLIRFYLALSVLFFHIGVNNGEWPFVPAGEAVYAFFVLSGFYITLGLNERYTAQGAIKEFYLSRIIRLWPTYLVSLGFMYYCGLLQQMFRFAIELPAWIAGVVIFSNLTMFGLDLLAHFSVIDGHIRVSEWGVDPHQNGMNYLMNFPAWSLAVELMFYATAPFVARSFKRSVAFLALGMIYWLAIKDIRIVSLGQINPKAHYPYYMLYFGLGIVTFWLNRLYPFCKANWKYYFLFVVSAWLVMSPNIGKFTYGYIALALVTPFLFDLTKHNAIDRFLGDLAYPIYVLQIPVGAAVRSYGIKNPSAMAYFVTIMVISILVLLLVERPIDKLKTKVMNKRLNHEHNTCTTSMPRPAYMQAKE